MSIDVLGDFLTIIRNGVKTSKPFVVAPFSKIKWNIALILKKEGFVKDVMMVERDTIKKDIKIFLKYVRGESVIHKIARVSLLGKRLYRGYKKIAPVIGGLGVSILSTNKGLVTNKEARKLGVGGEVICEIW
ncbi:MAG: 30S ribosomal protein S8 [Candidatus Babeliales bacterium]